MLVTIATGLLLAVVTIAIHAIGTTTLVDCLQRRSDLFQGWIGELKAYALTAMGLLVIHILETLLWATSYMFAVGREQFSSFEDAVYFSTVTFTTLGYGDIVIDGPWKMLSACQAMTGLLVFGWSTALLFAVVQRVWSRRAKTSNDSRS